MAHCVLHRGRLVTAVHHAIGALLVVAGTVRVPVGFLHPLAKARRVAFTEQITGTLPTKDVPGRVAPRSAAVFLVAGQEVEEKTRLAERPCARTSATAENVAKKLLGASAGEKVCLIRRPFIRISRRYRDAIDAERAGLVEKPRDAVRVGIVEQGAVDINAKAACLRGSNCGYGTLVDALFAHRVVVHLAVAVEVHRPDEVRARLEQMEPFLQQQGVRAQVDELAPRNDAGSDRRDLLVQQGLSAGDGDDRLTERDDGLQAFVDRQALVQDLVGVIDLAAAGARQIAAEERLEHEHQRISFAPSQLLANDVGADARFLKKRNGHDGWASVGGSDQDTFAGAARTRSNSAGSRNSTFSSIPGSTDTSIVPRRPNASSTSSTNSSGAEAPAVIPTVSASRTHAASNSLPSAIR